MTVCARNNDDYN